jgi:hypothetical protein
MGFIDGRIVQDTDGKSVVDKIKNLNDSLDTNVSNITNVSNTVNDIVTKSKFEKVTFSNVKIAK